MSFVTWPLWMLCGNITHTKYTFPILNGRILAFKKWFITFHNIMMKYVMLRIKLYCKRLKTYASKLLWFTFSIENQRMVWLVISSLKATGVITWSGILRVAHDVDLWRNGFKGKFNLDPQMGETSTCLG